MPVTRQASSRAASAFTGQVYLALFQTLGEAPPTATLFPWLQAGVVGTAVETINKRLSTSYMCMGVGSNCQASLPCSGPDTGQFLAYL